VEKLLLFRAHRPRVLQGWLFLHKNGEKPSVVKNRQSNLSLFLSKKSNFKRN
jgi:hypothetical protein